MVGSASDHQPFPLPAVATTVDAATATAVVNALVSAGCGTDPDPAAAMRARALPWIRRGTQSTVPFSRPVGESGEQAGELKTRRRGTHAAIDHDQHGEPATTPQLIER